MHFSCCFCLFACCHRAEVWGQRSPLVATQWYPPPPLPFRTAVESCNAVCSDLLQQVGVNWHTHTDTLSVVVAHYLCNNRVFEEREGGRREGDPLVRICNICFVCGPPSPTLFFRVSSFCGFFTDRDLETGKPQPFQSLTARSALSLIGVNLVENSCGTELNN